MINGLDIYYTSKKKQYANGLKPVSTKRQQAKRLKPISTIKGGSCKKIGRGLVILKQYLSIIYNG